ncbi:peptidase family m28 containing protein, partial [Trichuris trichiura]
ASHKPSFFNTNQIERLCALSNSTRLRNYLQPILVSRPVGSDNHVRVQKYLSKSMENLGYKVEAEPFTLQTNVGPKTFTNIIATLNPTAPRRLTLACHYDSKDFRPQFDFIGATDSAVPCAIMLDVADSLQRYACNGSAKVCLCVQQCHFVPGSYFAIYLFRRRRSVQRMVQFRFPLRIAPVGSISALPSKRKDALVLLDLMGARNPNFFAHHQYTFLNVYRILPETEAQLKMVKGCLHQMLTMFHNQMTRAFIEDDHLPFLERGVKVVHLIPLPFPTVWHTKQDDQSALHYPTIENLATIFRVFTARYLKIII